MWGNLEKFYFWSLQTDSPSHRGLLLGSRESKRRKAIKSRPANDQLKVIYHSHDIICICRFSSLWDLKMFISVNEFHAIHLKSIRTRNQPQSPLIAAWKLSSSLPLHFIRILDHENDVQVHKHFNSPCWRVRLLTFSNCTKPISCVRTSTRTSLTSNGLLSLSRRIAQEFHNNCDEQQVWDCKT